MTGTGAPLPGTGYATAALVQLPAGTGMVLAAATDRGAAGDPVTITGPLTADGLPLTGAAVRAEVFHPDGDTTTEVGLADDGTGGDAVAGDGDGCCVSDRPGGARARSPLRNWLGCSCSR